MNSALLKKLSRLSQMSPHELYTRLGQATTKRLDAAAYRLRLPQNNHRSVHGKATWGEFFWPPEEVRERTALIQAHLPGNVAKIVSEADQNLQHEFHLLGYEKVQYGPKIDWHLDPINGKTAPLIPWFKIRFLDSAEVGDHKVIWELSRHQHLVTLAKAWRFTQDRKYVEEMLKQWYAWQCANRYPIGINWASSLEVAFRSLSWLWVRYLLSDCPSLPPKFEVDLSNALVLNARHIERYLSTYFSPNTHLLGEALALLFIGTLCPGITSAKRFRALGLQILIQQAKRQVRPDGTYFEQSHYYHVYALDFFLHARLLAERNEIPVAANLDATVNKMLDVVDGLSQAGSSMSFGDDDGGRLFDPRRNRPEHLADPLAIGALLFGREDLAKTARLTEESIWLFGDSAVVKFSHKSNPDRKLRSGAFEAGGIYLLSHDNEQMMIDAGPQGALQGGHGHADALAVQLRFDSRPWLVDPGTYSYLSEYRDAFRGTAAHNTARVDGIDQAIPSGPFGWDSMARVQAETWTTGETYSFFAGSHTGYARLPDSVVHRRFLVYLHGHFWFVRDVFEGHVLHQLETFWHFASDLTVTRREGAFLAAPIGGSEAAPSLVLLPVENANWTTRLASANVSKAYGVRSDAPLVECSARLKLPVEHAMLLRTTTAGRSVLKDQLLANSSNEDASVYRYQEHGSTHFIAFAKSSAERWTIGEWQSDATFFYSRFHDGRLVHLVLCSGAFLKFRGESLLTHSKKVDRFEWILRNGKPLIFSSDELDCSQIENIPSA